MALNAKTKTGNKVAANRVPQPNIEPGGHAARVVQVIDLGLQPQRPFKGTVKEPVDMLYVTYELSHQFMVDEKGEEEKERPRWISEDFPFYSLEADKAKSTLRYNAIDPKGTYEGDWTQLAGQACTVVVVGNAGKGDNAGKIFDNVGSVTPAMKMPGYVQPPLVNDPVVFDLSAPDLEVFNKLPPFLQDRIKGNLNYQGSPLQKLLGETVSTPASAPTDASEEEVEENPY